MTDAFFNYQNILKRVHAKAETCGRQLNAITLIAVSKNYPCHLLDSVYQAGGRDFGESRIQEALNKIPQMPADCRWHLIGTLQTNKVVKAVSSFHLIHSVDSPALAKKIAQVSEEQGIVTPILLQVNTSGEARKHGLSQKAWEEALSEVNQLAHVKIEGLMTMAPLTDDPQIIRRCFRLLRQCRDEWQSSMADPSVFKQLSMGMSNDYMIAIEEGATLLRIGTAIFGERIVNH